MTLRRLLILVLCLVAMLACLLVGGIVSLTAKAGSQVSVTFLGLTNDAFGANEAVFQFTNGSAQDFGFSTGPVEIRGAEGWPKGSNQTAYVLRHLGPAYKVSAGEAQTFMVPVSNVEGVTWRAPIVYAKCGSRLGSWVDRVKVVLGQPVGGVALGTNTPEMVGLPDRALEPTRR